jgi:ribonuclease P protein component
MSASSAPLQRQTFRKSEKLCSRKIILDLAKKGKVIHARSFRLSWLETILPILVPVQIAFSVPKRNFKSAVERNRIKRRMREVYRKNKSKIYSLILPGKKQFALLIVYTGNTIPTLKETENQLLITLQHFAEDIQKHFR